MPGFFTQYGHVKYLLDRPLRMTGRSVCKICGC